MRRLLIAALAFSALPALAQDDPERDEEVVIEIETDERLDDDGPVRIEVRRDGDREVIIRRRGGAGEMEDEVVRFEMPDVEGLLRDGPLAVFRSEGGPFPMLGGGVSPETRERMRTLRREASDLARQARAADGAERQRLERQLDATLGDLFDVRGQARQEEADHLRERARELMAEADEKEASLRERARRRAELIEARRAELLGESTADW